MNEKVFYYLKKAIVCIVAIMSLVMLCFPLLKFSIEDETIFKDSGFSLLGFKSEFVEGVEEFKWAEILLGMSSLFELLLAISLLIISVYVLIKGKDGKLEKFVLIGALISALIYMIFGIVFKLVYIDLYGIDADLISKYLKTLSFIPFIIQAVLIVGYVALNYIEKKYKIPQSIYNSKVSVQPERKVNKPVATVAPNSVADELIKLKELLDAGILTQEEFDVKKKELLAL